jgi:hypothetical protein
MLSKTIIGALAALAFIPAALAADKGIGGDCCADLEGRIADLESTVARKGNKKVSLTVYGVVNTAVVFWDDNLTGQSDQRIVQNPTDPTRLGFVGKGVIAPGYAGGYVVEIGIGQWDLLTDQLGVDKGDEIYVLKSAGFIETPMGIVWLGKFKQATDGVSQVTVANTDAAVKLGSLRPLLGGNGVTTNVDLFDGQEGLNLVRVDSATWQGFTLSASWSNEGSQVGGAEDSVWDVALRYAADVGGFKYSAAVGYRQGAVFPGLDTPFFIPSIAFDQTTISGSAGIYHFQSGLFVNGMYGQTEFAGGAEVKGWHVMPGWEKNVFGFGATTIFAEYASFDLGMPDEVTWYGAGIVQKFNGANLDLYATARNLQPNNGADDALVGIVGARIGF